MNIIQRTTFAAALVALVTAGSAQAQAGRADLRYASPMPGTVTFTTVDSLESTTSGLPTGEMESQGVMRFVSRLQFTPVADGMAVRATLEMMSGTMQTPMGPVPLDADRVDPVEFTMGVEGPDPDQMPASFGAMPDPGSPGAAASLMGMSRALSGLLRLPGRALMPGESWTDTIRITQRVDGLTVEVTGTMRGTYESDTAVDGRTLNVLRITSEVTSQGSGTMMDQSVTQSVTADSREMVLWDSARHIPLFRDGETETESEMIMEGQGLNMVTTGRTRTIMRATPRG